VDVTQTAKAAANGTASVTLGPIPTGVQWTVYQISTETSTPRPGSSVTVRKNGRFITNSPLSLGAASAQGPPFILAHPSDQVTASFAGMTVGDTCFVTWLYQETLWSVTPPAQAV
jgi:hypothetical protein